ncbi:hypothetical protein NYP20_17680 [Pseudomonas sp. N3-W]|jgi:hypothetical protein|uniref:Uncharacterized protein n=1 Tax=Pseudomonas fungipugnans TaxID=3024217 RepID=A0ABT6QIM9_9PSED|nr:MULTISPECIES: hypothetical protein [unclassified Pseudomonas]MDI2590738.1 hypothetical protein [Pseudomonas sp. 681]UWF47178.1 hypothetical protein NYP20_17680 [Pseudomonas sp. N3-W]
MTLPLPENLNKFADQIRRLKGMSGALRGNSFLIQLGDEINAKATIQVATDRGLVRLQRYSLIGYSAAQRA